MLETLQNCGETVLQINQLAYEVCVDDFQRRVLCEIDRLIGFDRAWWGLMSPHVGGFALLSSHRANLPDSYVEKWRTYTSDDRLAISVNNKPTHTVRFNTHELHSTRGLYEINADVGNKHALCTAIKLPNRHNDFLFISLFRGGRSPQFDITETWAKQFLMPHVFMAWRHNLMRNYDSTRHVAPEIESLASAFVDLELVGVIDAPKGFVALMNKAWPSWTPAALPRSLVDALRGTDGGRRVVFGDLAFSLQPSGALQLLTIWKVCALDKLTAREAQVAAAFSSGQSYKEVARSLGISPATVRHYLREIYVKLDLTDKAELANLVHRSAQVQTGILERCDRPFQAIMTHSARK